MTRGESPEFVNRPCHQCAVLRKHCQWSRGQLYFTLWKHFPGVLSKKCAYPAYCGEMWLFVIQNFSTQVFKLKISGFFYRKLSLPAQNQLQAYYFTVYCSHTMKSSHNVFLQDSMKQPEMFKHWIFLSSRPVFLGVTSAKPSNLLPVVMRKNSFSLAV